MDPLTPEAYGFRTMPVALDRWREVRPDKVFASLLLSPDVSQGFRDVSIAEVANAVDAFAWYLVNTFGRPTDFRTITYIGVNDLRYAIVMHGAIKAGYKTLFASARNPPDQNASLVQQTQSTLILHSAELERVVKGIQELLPDVKNEVVPPLDHWINAFTEKFPYTKTFEEAKWDPILYVHSSGSTGQHCLSSS